MYVDLSSVKKREHVFCTERLIEGEGDDQAARVGSGCVG
jgi:hypothetical protein